MKVVKQLICLALLLITLVVNAQPPKKFYHRFGGNGYDVGYDVKQTFDLGYIITGSTSSFGQGNTDMYLVKLDSMGQKIFETSFGGYNNETGKSIVQLADSGFIMVGHTSSSGFGGYDVFLVKADKTGAFVWQKTIGGEDWDFAYSMDTTADGGLIIAGTTYSYGRGNADGYVIKTDANGNVLWSKTYGGKKDDEFKSVIQTADGNYALTGYTKSYNDSLGDAWVFKIDQNGDSLYCKFFGGNKEDFGNEIIEHSNTNFYVVGGSQSFNTSGVMDAYLLHLDNSHNIIYEATDNTSSSFQIFTSVVESNRSNLINLIAKETVTAFALQCKMIEYGTNLNYNNAIDFGSNLNDETFKLIATKDKGYACIGYTYGYGAILSDIYFLKTDSTLFGNPSIVSVKENVFDNISTEIYPNPTENEINVSTVIEINTKELKLYSINGQEICMIGRIHKISDYKLKLNIEDLNNGVYFLKYFNECKRISIVH